MVGLVRQTGWNPFKLTANHQVLAYAYEVDGDTVTLRICDPNWPGRDDVAISVNASSMRQSTAESLAGLLRLPWYRAFEREDDGGVFPSVARGRCPCLACTHKPARKSMPVWHLHEEVDLRTPFCDGRIAASRKHVTNPVPLSVIAVLVFSEPGVLVPPLMPRIRDRENKRTYVPPAG